MRIIHTADWHLCDRLGRVDRTRDLEQRVEFVAELCEVHAADVLLIAGDIFEKETTVDQITESLGHVRSTFAPFFARGGTILAVTGNHDIDRRINMVRAGMLLAAPVAGRDGDLPRGRMYLLNGRGLATLQGASGQRVQFVIVPYPFTTRYDLSTDEYRTKEEENNLLHNKVAEWIRDVSDKPGFDSSLPTVLAAHLHVRGAQAHNLYKLSERDDVPFDYADLNPGWAYIALGHIHKPQELRASNVRYCGSLDRLDFGETHDDHGVNLIEIGKTGLVREPERLKIPATPFLTVAITDPETELDGLTEKYPDHETAIVRITVTPPAAGMSCDEIARRLKPIFPRWTEIKWADAGSTGSDSAPAFTPRADFETNVRNYLERELQDDSDREALFALAESFLKPEAEA